MGTHYFTCPKTQRKISWEATFEAPDFVNSWWSSDKEGKNKLTKAYLEDTVYFHIEAKGIREGKELKLKLYDYDDFLTIDSLNLDDDEFPDKEINKTAKIELINGKRIATIELKLEPSWAKLIKDDPKPFKEIELYWQVSVEGLSIEKDLPQEKEAYLKVRYSKRDLYVKPMDLKTELPEMVSIKGGLIFLMNSVKGKIQGEIIDDGQNGLNKMIDKSITKIVVGKMLKDDLLCAAYDLEKGITKSPHLSTFEYFANRGARVKILGLLKKASNIFNYTDLADFALQVAKGLDTSKTITLPLGQFNGVNVLMDMMVSRVVDDIQQQHEEVFQNKLLKAKAEGLESVRGLISTFPEFGYTIEEYKKDTLNELLKGKFKTIDEMDDYNYDSYGESRYILIKKIINPYSGRNQYIVESIFMTE